MKLSWEKRLIPLTGLILIGSAWAVARMSAHPWNAARMQPITRTPLANAVLSAPTPPCSAHQERREGEGKGEDPNDVELTPQISREQAAKFALKAQSGVVTQVELENENGKAVYGVSVTASDGKKYDVKVDGKDGSILKIEAHDKAEQTSTLGGAPVGAERTDGKGAGTDE